MTRIKQEIFSRLSDALRPTVLEIIDDSAKHRGHRDSGSAQETHFRIIMISAFFEGKNSMMRHRIVYEILDDLMKKSIHAVSLTLRTPQEHETLKS